MTTNHKNINILGWFLINQDQNMTYGVKSPNLKD
jgi:hypothetical protein